MMYSKEQFTEKLLRELSSAGLEAFSHSAEKLYTVVSRLDEFGKKFNLTAITDPDQVIKKHLIDCLFAAKQIPLPEGKTLIDIGAGAGFPSLPVSAALPSLHVTALDSTAKKVNYMNDTAKAAGITNFTAVCARAEEYALPYRETFDFATARAVASLPVLCELCIPYVKIGGKFIAMKGAAAEEETEEAKNAAKKLGCAPAEILPYSLPGMEDKRFLIIYTKISPTPEAFPRNFSQISKKPL
ncbi:MAG: 16S rRNA (guanine(527)-N(7))-methyltransferase RsmG [Clostridia bacterium]|nr:16S rRNA (guanine(527)-N(7))-methyltransferase RsmG [Clostridia bacterium]